MASPTHWGRVRDELRRPAYDGKRGRRIALEIVDAMQRHAKAGPLFRFGTWREAFAALGLPIPCARTAREALGLLASLTGLVVRVRDRIWRIASNPSDAPEPGQVGYRRRPPAGSRNRTVSSGRKPAGSARSPVAATPRVRARAAQLEREWGRRPRDPAARQLAAAVERLGAVDRREVFAVTLTAAEGLDVTSAARAFASHLAGEAGAVLVPERSPVGRLHYHGMVIAPSRAVVESLWGWCASGRAHVEAVRPGDFARLRYVAAYAMKAPAPGLEIISSGVLARWREPAPSCADGAERRQSAEPPTGGETTAAPCTPDTGVALEVSTAAAAVSSLPAAVTGRRNPLPSESLPSQQRRHAWAPARHTPAAAEPERRGLWSTFSAVVRKAARVWRHWFGPGP